MSPQVASPQGVSPQDVSASDLRVVSLVPSATETLLAWGVRPLAVTRFCEQGDRFPTVGGTKDPDVEGIGRLSPDLVVVCDQENRLPDFEALVALGLAVHVISITALGDVEPQMIALAEALGLPAALGAACGLTTDSTTVTPIAMRAYVPIWRRPWMTIGDDTYGASGPSAPDPPIVTPRSTCRPPGSWARKWCWRPASRMRSPSAIGRSSNRSRRSCS